MENNVPSKFNDKSKAVLEEIKALIVQNPVTLAYKDEGKIIKNSRTFDLSIRKDCDDLESSCKEAIGNGIYFSARTMVREDPTTSFAAENVFCVEDLTGKKLKKKLEHMNPWLGLIFLIDKLVHQMEVSDLCDPCDPQD